MSVSSVNNSPPPPPPPPPSKPAPQVQQGQQNAGDTEPHRGSDNATQARSSSDAARGKNVDVTV